MKKFLKEYRASDRSDPSPWLAPSKLDKKSIQFLIDYAGTTFNNGLYRLHNRTTGKYSQENAEIAFPDLKDFILVFGFDWQGRQYSFDLGNPNQILLLDVAEGNYYSVEVNFKTFHDKILIEHKEDTLDLNAFNQWRNLNNSVILHNECIGYKIPLFLNGKDDLSNMEKIDLDVYWNLNATLLKQLNNINQ